MLFVVAVLIVIAHAMLWLTLCNASELPKEYDGPEGTALEGCKLVETDCVEALSVLNDEDDYYDDGHYEITGDQKSCVKVVC